MHKNLNLRLNKKAADKISGFFVMVEKRGFEPLTSSLQS
jgi:hypothetical protein